MYLQKLMNNPLINMQTYLTSQILSDIFQDTTTYSAKALSVITQANQIVKETTAEDNSTTTTIQISVNQRK